jgi:hypothetical protein
MCVLAVSGKTETRKIINFISLLVRGIFALQSVVKDIEIRSSTKKEEEVEKLYASSTQERLSVAD